MINKTKYFKFSEDLEKFSKKINVDLATTTRAVASQLLTGVVRRTPVDTGLARAGWVLGVQKNPPSPGKKILSEQAVVQRGVRKLARIRYGKGKKGRPLLIYISNYVPYTIFLENGSSMQAPSGMVATTIAEVGSKIRAAK